MIKFAGHTMGTPKLDIRGAIDLFKEIGLDGIEVRVAEDGQIDSESITNSEAKALLAYANEAGIEFACLTSYDKDFTADENRDDTISKLKRVVELADILRCRNIRVYGGMDPAPEGVWFVENWNRTVSGIREVAEFAEKYGVRVCVETHIGSLTMSVRDTRRLVEDVDMANVGILFDYAWVEIADVESGKEAVEAAGKHVFHCHVKDWRLESRIPLKKTSRLMGEGNVRWNEVLPALLEIGYDGYITDEYEKFWYPDDLPEPEIGMKRNLRWMKDCLEI